MRYFRAMPAVVEQIRAALDAAWGFPNAATKTDTAITPANKLPADEAGRVYMQMDAVYCEYELPAQLLPVLLAAGEVEELTRAAFFAAADQPPPE